MNNIKRNSELIIAMICFISIIICFAICLIPKTIFIGLLGTVATLYFGSIKHKIENDKIFKELFKDFNSRYDKEFNDLINTLKYNIEKEVDEKERNLIIDYFNLCSEEYLWKSRNRIPKNVWESWKAGILENIKIKQIKKIYLEEISTEIRRKSFYGLVEELEKNTGYNNV